MSKWIDVDVAVRVYMPDDYKGPGVFHEDDGEWATMQIAEACDQKTTREGAMISIQGYDPGEVMTDDPHDER